MRFAAIADVHANYLALEAVIADIRAQNIDGIVNLGDMASGPLEARRTMDALMALDAVHVLGNHDRYLIDRPPEKMGSWDRPAHAQLDATHLDWLSAVPPTRVFRDQVFLCHATPDSDEVYWLETVLPDGTVRIDPHNSVRRPAWLHRPQADDRAIRPLREVHAAGDDILLAFDRQAEASIPAECQNKTICRTGVSRQTDPRQRKSICDCMRSDDFAGAVKLGDTKSSVGAERRHPIGGLVFTVLKESLGTDLETFRLLQQLCGNGSGPDDSHGVPFGVVTLMSDKGTGANSYGYRVFDVVDRYFRPRTGQGTCAAPHQRQAGARRMSAGIGQSAPLGIGLTGRDHVENDTLACER
jgi:hypothetical protein